ncbi:MAG: heme-binding protein, partial [Planctomycetaceae bacterium]
VISDQYQASTVLTTAGKVITGRVLGTTDGKISVLTDPVDATKIIELKTDDVEEVTPSKVSLMPKELLNQLNEDEVLDLIAYLLSRGNPQASLFAP